MKDLVTVEMICSRYGCARHKGAEILRALPHFRVGNRLFARSSDLEAWERSRMTQPVEKGVREPKTPYLIPRKRA